MRSILGIFVIAIALSICSGCGRKATPTPAQGPITYTKPKEYKRLTTEILASIPDKDLEFAVISYISNKIGDYSREAEVVGGMSAGMRMVWTTWDVEGEVCNGGFHQYFYNSEGEFASDAVAGYRLIGATKHADLMARAVQLFIKETPMQSRIRKDRSLETFASSYKETDLGKLDDIFYDLEDKENVSKLRIAYIRQHPEEFVGE